MKTVFAKPGTIRGDWYLVDASGKTLGRLATEAASVLSGKRSTKYTPFMDMGDHVVVINASKAVLKGNKVEQKLYRHHTRYPGGLRTTTAKEMIAKRPERVIELAIKGMLPKTKLGRAMAKKLKIYAAAEHPHSAQRPQAYDLTHNTNS